MYLKKKIEFHKFSEVDISRRDKELSGKIWIKEVKKKKKKKIKLLLKF